MIDAESKDCIAAADLNVPNLLPRIRTIVVSKEIESVFVRTESLFAVEDQLRLRCPDEYAL